jgi:pimeloyl-ACP methyl ester carboxylesterase
LNAAPKRIRTSVLDVAYEESGAADGAPVFLMHGWPYDPRCYDAVIAPLVAAGARVIVPYLRGFGPTRFLEQTTPRSGQQAALGNDLRELMDALSVDRAVLAGYDWGGRAACIVAALWPERVRGLVTVNAYNIQNIPGAGKPTAPAQEHRLWYQWYFQMERGRAGVEANRRELCRLLWRLWSPHWLFDDATFERSAAAFDNPDFVAVTIHSYRHRYGNAAGDPKLEEIETAVRATTQNHGADNRFAGRSRLRASARQLRASRRFLPRTLSAALTAADRAQPAAGRSRNFRRCRSRNDAGLGDQAR